MIELDDCAKELYLTNLSGLRAFGTEIQMVIKAPRGTMALFDKGYISPDTQCEAIIAFMNQHKEDK